MAKILHTQDLCTSLNVVGTSIVVFARMKTKCEHLSQCAFITALQTANTMLSNTINLQNSIIATRTDSAPPTRRVTYRRGRDKIDFTIHLN